MTPTDRHALELLAAAAPATLSCGDLAAAVRRGDRALAGNLARHLGAMGWIDWPGGSRAPCRLTARGRAALDAARAEERKSDPPA